MPYRYETEDDKSARTLAAGIVFLMFLALVGAVAGITRTIAKADEASVTREAGEALCKPVETECFAAVTSRGLDMPKTLCHASKRTCQVLFEEMVLETHLAAPDQTLDACQIAGRFTAATVFGVCSMYRKPDMEVCGAVTEDVRQGMEKRCYEKIRSGKADE